MAKRILLHFAALKKARKRAFSLTELLISLIIMAIIGGAVITGLGILLYSSRQTDDHTTASHEIENTINALRLEFSNIGLAMPNNSGATGSFNIAFTGPDSTHHPVMAYMGDVNRTDRNWGGPVTIGTSGAHTNMIANTVKKPDSNGFYAGAELFYAWAAPTGVRLSGPEHWNPTGGGTFSSKNADTLTFGFMNPGDAGRLEDFIYDGRKIGISSNSTNRGASLRSWILFPSFRIPLLIDEGGINTTQNTVSAKVSPYSYRDDFQYEYTGTLYGFEEVHLAQAACLFAENGRLIRRVYGDSVNNYIDTTVATNIAGVYFLFDSGRRVLTMYIAAFGNSAMDVKVADNEEYIKSTLPDIVSGDVLIPGQYMNRRILIQSMTWRIKN